MNRHTATVRRHDVVDVDRYGDPTTEAVEHTVPGCVLAPRASNEVQNYSDTVLTEFTLLAPAGADIRATDEVLVEGVRYSVEADPTVWSSPFASWRPGVQVALRVVRG